MTPAEAVERALTLAEAAWGGTAPNPPVGCVLLAPDGTPIGEGQTAPGGRPHAEAAALAAAGPRAAGASAYVTLEPCAHISARGPACADLLIAAGIARAHVLAHDPDPRTAGRGIARLRARGIAVELAPPTPRAAALIAAHAYRVRTGRPRVTIKLALSIDGRLAPANGPSRWLTGPEARAHAHLERARADIIVVGRGTLATDDPLLTVRLPGHEHRSPHPAVLSRTLQQIPASARLAARDPLILRSPTATDALPALEILVEGGAAAAAAFLLADRAQRLVIYRAPILLGASAHPALSTLGDISLADAHGRWSRTETRTLGADTLEIYGRVGEDAGS